VDDAAEPKEDLSGYGLAEPQLTVVIAYRRKGDPEDELKELTLHFGNARKDEEGDNESYFFNLAEGEHKSRVYLVQSYRFDGWSKKLEDFLPKPEEETAEETDAGKPDEGETNDGATPPAGEEATADSSAPPAAGTAPDSEEPDSGGSDDN
jgi:hypothetical protein